MSKSLDRIFFFDMENSPFFFPSGAYSNRKKGTRRGTLNPEAKNVLKAWMFSREHFAHPYPSEEEKEELAAEAGIEVKQLSNWFTNARKRLWQPVLRQSGVEVKNFLSTGRGGPRGAKLEIPTNIALLASNSPPASPQSPGFSPYNTTTFPEKETACRNPSVPERLIKRLKRTDSTTTDEENEESPQQQQQQQLQQQLQQQQQQQQQKVPQYYLQKPSPKCEDWKLNLNDSRVNPDARKDVVVKSGFRELEILAAKSLLGLQQEYQSVH